jgi:uncharacterized protein DUF6665
MDRTSHRDLFKTPADALHYEIVQEQASALGRLGRGLEAALAALRAFDAAHGRSAATRSRRAALVEAAGEALWMFIVQREACGLRDSRTVMRDYQVPSDVQARQGITTKTR